ncbi:DeoR/GlpR family DNA-binding transcription regulator [Streptococcus urinalis]|uniref:DeoR/GlpR family DNA-binding transcription regulator n=1 Tax=Streptococcus urinalis TaxID=149016 RepID=UPI001E4EE8DF|nr:hypothetical protein [Streptococcus urinalis]
MEDFLSRERFKSSKRGASLAQWHVEKTLNFRNEHLEEKQSIARYAMQMIEGNHSLILDNGTTTLATCKYLNTMPSMDIFTTSLDITNHLNGDLHQVFLTGGRKREKNMAMIGHWTQQILKSIHVDVCLLGTTGILDANGPTSHSYQELTIKQTIMEQSDLVYLLADSSKFQEKGLHEYAKWSNIDAIITDQQLPSEIYQKLVQKVPIYIVGDI